MSTDSEGISEKTAVAYLKIWIVLYLEGLSKVKYLRWGRGECKSRYCVGQVKIRRLACYADVRFNFKQLSYGLRHCFTFSVLCVPS
jgi:hypothetical protein